MGQELLSRAAAFRARLQAGGLDTMNSDSQIIPMRVGDNAKALAFAERLRTEGFLAIAIRPPTVPAGTARIRLSLTLAHTPDVLEQAADRIIVCARKEGIA